VDRRWTAVQDGSGRAGALGVFQAGETQQTSGRTRGKRGDARGCPAARPASMRRTRHGDGGLTGGHFAATLGRSRGGRRASCCALCRYRCRYLAAWLRRHQKTSRRQRSRIRLAEGRRGLAECGAGATWCSRMQPRVSGVCLPLAGVKFAQSDAAAADGREAERQRGREGTWRGLGLARHWTGQQSRAEHSKHSTAQQHHTPPSAAWSRRMRGPDSFCRSARLSAR
jgi:hypothetical protein